MWISGLPDRGFIRAKCMIASDFPRTMSSKKWTLVDTAPGPWSEARQGPSGCHGDAGHEQGGCHAECSSGVSKAGWRELRLKEDWWAIYLGLGLVIVGVILFANGASLKWLAVTPAKWTSVSQLLGDLAANALRYLAQFVFWLAAFSVALTAMGHGRASSCPLSWCSMS